MNLTLGQRALLIIAGINVAVFAALGATLVRPLNAERETLTLDLTEDLVRTLRGMIQPDRPLNVASILAWPGWLQVEDAVLVDSNLAPGLDGALVPRGVSLNPTGRNRRDPLLDERAVVDSLAACVRDGTSRRVAGGRAVPLRIEGLSWGACWFRLPPSDELGALLRMLLPWLLISTGGLVLANYWLLRGTVLTPVERLADTARRLSAGELEARAPAARYGDEIDDLVTSFNDMAARLEGYNRELESRVAEATEQARQAEAAAMIQRRLAAMGELAAGIAHEINNPLGGLINAARALDKPELTPERRARYIELLDSGLERIRATVGQVLRMAPRETEPVDVDLVATALDAAALVRHRAATEGVELELIATSAGGVEVVLDGDTAALDGSALLHVLGARNELGQALLNLLVNALDSLEAGVGASFGDAAPRIELRLERAGDAIHIDVVDNGPGLDADTLERARDVFFSTKEVGRGTGLGLSIVHNIVDGHSGSVELSSRPGAGFRARITLPTLVEPRSNSARETEPNSGSQH